MANKLGKYAANSKAIHRIFAVNVGLYSPRGGQARRLTKPRRHPSAGGTSTLAGPETTLWVAKTSSLIVVKPARSSVFGSLKRLWRRGSIPPPRRLKMKLTIIARSDRDAFAGVDADGDYSVLSLDDTKEIELGDILSAEAWNDRGGEWKTVKNLTKKESVRICLESWGRSKAAALDLLRRLNNPTKILTLKD
jgi:hypothetical protein